MPRVWPLLAMLVALAIPASARAAEPVVTHVDTPGEIHVDLAAQVRATRLAGVRTCRRSRCAVSPAATQTYLPTTWCGPGGRATGALS